MKELKAVITPRKEMVCTGRSQWRKVKDMLISVASDDRKDVFIPLPEGKNLESFAQSARVSLRHDRESFPLKVFVIIDRDDNGIRIRVRP